MSNNMMTRSIAVLRRPKGARSLSVLSSIWFAVGFPIILLVIWAVWATFDPQKFFPSPIAIIGALADTWFVDNGSGSRFTVDVLPSLGRLVVGIVASIVIGVVAGTVIGLVRWLRELLEPTLEFFRAVPPPVLVPILMMVFGAGDATRVIVILAGAVWPVLLNTIEGVRATDSVMTETARSYALTPIQRLRYLVLPSASPRIMTGIRQCLSVALILLVISEMFNSSSGLGYQISYFQTNYQIPEMWSGILLLGLVGVLLAVIFGAVERRVLAWYHGIKEVERA
jgi:ABC-type nitrate/sulfonate/bicarbonate transport system permease component